MKWCNRCHRYHKKIKPSFADPCFLHTVVRTAKSGKTVIRLSHAKV